MNPFFGAPLSQAMGDIIASLVQGKKYGIEREDMLAKIQRELEQQRIENELAQQKQSLDVQQAGTMKDYYGAQADKWKYDREPIPIDAATSDALGLDMFVPELDANGQPIIGPDGQPKTRNIGNPRTVDPRVFATMGQRSKVVRPEERLAENSQAQDDYARRVYGVPTGVGDLNEDYIIQKYFTGDKRFIVGKNPEGSLIYKKFNQISSPELRMTIADAATSLRREATSLGAVPFAFTNTSRRNVEEKTDTSQFQRDYTQPGSKAQETNARVTIVMPSQAYKNYATGEAALTNASANRDRALRNGTQKFRDGRTVAAGVKYVDSLTAQADKITPKKDTDFGPSKTERRRTLKQRMKLRTAARRKAEEYVASGIVTPDVFADQSIYNEGWGKNFNNMERDLGKPAADRARAARRSGMSDVDIIIEGQNSKDPSIRGYFQDW